MRPTSLQWEVAVGSPHEDMACTAVSLPGWVCVMGGRGWEAGDRAGRRAGPRQRPVLVWFPRGSCVGPREQGGEGACESFLPWGAGGQPHTTGPLQGVWAALVTAHTHGLQGSLTPSGPPRILKPPACATRPREPLVPWWDMGPQREDGFTVTSQGALRLRCLPARSALSLVAGGNWVQPWGAGSPRPCGSQAAPGLKVHLEPRDLPGRVVVDAPR